MNGLQCASANHSFYICVPSKQRGELFQQSPKACFCLWIARTECIGHVDGSVRIDEDEAWDGIDAPCGGKGCLLCSLGKELTV